MNFAEINLIFLPLLYGEYMNMLDILTFYCNIFLLQHFLCVSLASQDLRKLQRQKETKLHIQVGPSSVK